jgi:nucleoside-diphosphate-sugar epimerase
VEPVDLSSREEVATWRRGKPIFNAAFHLAAIVPTSFDSTEAEASFLTNVIMTQNVLSLAIRDGATFIYASSTSVYGINRNIPLTEDMLPRPDNLYSLAKYVGEGLCEVAHIRHGLAAMALRICAPYGPQQTARTVVNIFLRSALRSQDLALYGTGERVQDFTYVSDVTQAFWLAYEKRGCGVCNIASGQPVTMRELAETVLSVVPNTRSEIIFPGQPDPQESYRGVFAIEKAKRELGYEPRTTLAEGLRACLTAVLEGER